MNCRGGALECVGHANSLTNEAGATVNIDISDIKSYVKYWLVNSKRYAYQITPIEGTTMCLKEDK